MKKNLIIIMPDQLRADYLGCYGNQAVRTPHIDALADGGVLFENLYCAAPLCGPSRISFATSTYVGEHGHRNYSSEISPDVPNIVASLKNSGYRTGMFGKNHLFTSSRLHELWDNLDEICLGNYDGHPDYKHSFSAFTMAEEHPFNISKRLTNGLIDFIKSSEQPFLGWVNYQDPHPAFTCPAPYDTMFDPDSIELPQSFYDKRAEGRPIRNRVWEAHSEMHLCSEADMRKAIAHYMGQIAYIDDCVGEIMLVLHENGFAENTIVLFLSDHGELLGDYHITHKNPTFYDCLTKIPTIMHIPLLDYRGGRFAGLSEQVDLAPTLLELLDVPIPPTMVGKNMADGILKRNYIGRESVLVEAGVGAPTQKEMIPGYTLLAPHAPTSFGPGAMLRVGKFKLSIYADDLCELYDIEKDPKETENLYNRAEYAQVRSQMTETLVKRLLSVKVRDVGLKWDYPPYNRDVRFGPLE